MDMGLMQCAIGDGKGKTTALIGQLVRAQGQGFKCVCFQFLKTQPSGECAALGERAWASRWSVRRPTTPSLCLK